MSRGVTWALVYAALLGASHLTQYAGWVDALEIPPGALIEPPAATETRDGAGATSASARPNAVRKQKRSLRVPAFTAESPATQATETDVRLAYEVYDRVYDPAPARPVLVALHGSPGRARDLELVARQFATRYRVLVPDLPGFGESERWIPDYSIRAHARYVLYLLDREGLGQVHLFGHSMGSGVAQEILRLAPQRVLSLTIYGGIGIQEGEGSGDYYVEHFKYLMGYGLLVVLPELLPHFGALGPLSFRHAFIRNFLDTDQRPLRAALRKIQAPVLIVQGVHDPLVPAWAAEEHHRLIPHSELLMLDASHFMVFGEQSSRRLAAPILDFLDRYRPLHDRAQPGGYGAAMRADRGPGIARRESKIHLTGVDLPIAIDLGSDLNVNAWARLGALIGGTFVSEDLTCISAGLLIRANRLDLFTGLLGCFIGIFLGDLGLYLMGRLIGLGLVRSKRVARLLPPARLRGLAERFDREGWKLIFLSRFVPGTRFPVYTGAGIIGGRASRLILVALLAGLIWTPALVVLTILAGPAILAPIEYIAGEGWVAIGLAILLIFVILRSLGTLLTAEGRRQWLQKWRRLRHIEFWPAWLFYAPLVPWGLWFHIRYRGFGTLTASNPGIRDGGLIGESKAEILDCLPARWVLPYRLIPPGTPENRTTQVLDCIAGSGWSYPVILKPDVAQRGFGLRLARNAEDVGAYFDVVAQPVIVQVYHPGPFEAGVFYYRFPHEAEGRIFSITDKVFPEVSGDGRSTLRELILAHPRYSLQTQAFFERHQDRLDLIPARGEAVRLAIAGNHAQGTLFREGAHLYTEALRRRVDQIAREFPGFYFGRFDVRYATVEGFRNGEQFAIVELNGATSESTNLYDPQASLRFVYGTLWRQWDLMFRIGHANRQRGHRALSLIEIVRELWNYKYKRTDLRGD